MESHLVLGAYAGIAVLAGGVVLYGLIRMRKRDLNAEMKAVEDAMRKDS